MIASLSALNIIKKHEGFRRKAYNCPAGHATIGYGHKLHDGSVTKSDDKLSWTEEHAVTVLRGDTIIAEQALNKKIKVTVNQNQFDALVSWTFNLGIGRLSTCSWMRELNKGNFKEVPERMMRWNKATVGDKLIVLPGLKKRREEEVELFTKPYPED